MKRKGSLVLDYASQPPIELRVPMVVRLIMLLFLLPSLMIPFVNYAHSTSLMGFLWGETDSYLDRSSNLLAWLPVWGPLVFTGFLLVFYQLRMLIYGRLSIIEIGIGYTMATLYVMPVVGLLLMVVSSSIVYDHFRKKYMFEFGAICVVPIVVIVFSFLVFLFLGKRISHSTRACACMCISYGAIVLLATMAFWIQPGFSVGLNIGYAISLSVIIGALIELTTLAVLAFRRRAI